MNSYAGWLPAGASVVLVSAAQLGIRWAMSRLPPPPLWLSAELSWAALAVLSTAVLAYVASMLCWLSALKYLPLARAYSLLSISYILVYALAATLTDSGEPLTTTKSLGVCLVVTGVWVINSRRPQRSASEY
ncbi:4-amino-4-deoxy-L-arabinose-phosphoundecaprenol flippase subunit ArnF [Pseudomonas sp. NPDC090592]|uniref:4-amino-4-deoxy-L-arabinose-phosphoundecaprenol flippase subunit ArnF n=1 Tax=Pseudomonas sp. NPDC090592 TaxID=3364480 RepID=UPI00383A59C9